MSRPRQPLDVTIATLGAQGDGIAQTPDGPVYVPQAVPGDRLRVALGKRRGEGFVGEIIARLADGPGRVTPPCRHFSTCGGCATQHLDNALYAEWKRDLVATNLARRHLNPAVVAPLRRTAADGRRRVHLAARATAKGVLLGFNQRRSHRIMDIRDCLVMRPALRAMLGPLRALLATVLPRNTEARLLLTETRNGFDLLVTTPHDFNTDARTAWAEFAADNQVARIQWRPESTAIAEPLALLATPRVAFAHIDVAIPSGGFLQASARAESIMVEILLGAIGEAKNVADLFAGCGAFTLPLAKHGCHVHAVDYDADAIAALHAAAGAAQLGGRITGEARDLFRRPIQAKELSVYDAVLFDPPRAGAAAQVEQITRAAIPVVLAVSCNPASFASDAATLTGAGYDLQWVIPIDQFVYSQHVELVALFKI